MSETKWAETILQIKDDEPLETKLEKSVAKLLPYHSKVDMEGNQIIAYPGAQSIIGYWDVEADKPVIVNYASVCIAEPILEFSDEEVENIEKLFANLSESSEKPGTDAALCNQNDFREKMENS